MRLIDALQFSDGEIAAFVGAGGKTTAIFTAARELLTSSDNNKSNCKAVFVTTTTHLGKWQARLADHLIILKTIEEFVRFKHNLPRGVILFAGGEDNERLIGLRAEILDEIYKYINGEKIPLLIEADGSSQRPLKAPAEHEPVIPGFVKTVVVVAGLPGIGKPIIEAWVHRPEIFAKLAHAKSNDVITTTHLLRVLQNREGGLKNIPVTARRVMLLNQADSNQLCEIGRKLATDLTKDYQSVIIGSLIINDHADKLYEENVDTSHGEIIEVIENIAGIILAAGSSTRFGANKQLLKWRGKTFLRHIIDSALQSGIKPVIVVLGSGSDQIKREISDLPVRIVINKEWATGLSSSIRAGLNSLYEFAGGAIFFQADQPQTSPDLIQKLIEAHHKTLAPIVVPRISGQRGNPVLFDRNIFDELMSLHGDTGGRELFSTFPIEWVDWDDVHQRLDIDTPEDYEKFLKIYKDQ